MKNQNVDLIQKLLLKLPTVEEQEILHKSTSGLVAKKVLIQRKNGSSFIATRWVNPDTGKPNPIQHPKYKDYDDIEGTTDEEKIQNIVNSDKTAVQKQRELISLGVLGKQALDELTETKYKDSQHYLKNEAGIEDWKEFNINENLPTEPNPNAPKGDKMLSMAIADIHLEYGEQAAFEMQEKKKKEIAEKYGMTVQDKWDSYDTRLDMLLDGSLGLRAVMAYGLGGIGKSFTFEKKTEEKGLIEYNRELDMNPDEYDYVKIGGKIGSRETQRAMYEHRKKLIVFDDCDSMWNDEGLINVLKNVLDTSGKGKCQWAQRLPETSKGAGDEVPSSFVFSGRMIFITNLSKKDLARAGATPISESRAAGIDLTMNMDQTIERLESILPGIKLRDSDRNEMSDVILEDKQIALDVLKEVKNYAKLDQLNTRVLTGIIALARSHRINKGDYDRRGLTLATLQQFGY